LDCRWGRHLPNIKGIFWAFCVAFEVCPQNKDYVFNSHTIQPEKLQFAVFSITSV
jgi:hypothetical protein